jgi:hypothetical protein
MPANYEYRTGNLDLTVTNTTKTVGSAPSSVFQFQSTNGIRWICTADNGSNRVSLFQIAGTDGIVQSQSTITSNTLITKTVGTNPYSASQFQATDGTRWICTADYGSNRVSLFQIAGTDGIVQSQSTITANTLITKTVGTNPYSVFQFQATDGTRWICTADLSSNRVSLFQIAGTDGIVQSQSTITANTLITKAVGNNPYSVFQFQATNGTRWICTADLVSWRVSLFQIAGTDGIVQSQSTITANTTITKTVGSNPISVFEFQATNGTRWICTADLSSAGISLFQIAGTDGIVQSQSTITANTTITKTVGNSPRSVFQFQATDGTRWICTADNDFNRISLFQIAGTDGIVQSQSTITANTTITKTVGTNPYSVFQFQATDGTLWICTADYGSNRVSLFQISNPLGLPLPPGELINVNVLITSNFLVSTNLAELGSLVDYFNFAAGVSPKRPFAPTYNYSFTADDSGTVGSGAVLRFTTNTADITNSSGITIASGATLRLGKKSTYTIPLICQSGSTIEVFPDSDRSGSPLNLSSKTINSGVTINAVSGTATVQLASTAGITAGAGVTLQAPIVTYVRAVTGVPTGSSVLLAVRSANGFANLNQFTLASGNNSGNSTLLISTSIPADTPTSGLVRVARNTGVEDRLAYTSWSGSTFTLSGTLPATYSAGNGCYVGYLDVINSASTTITASLQYVADRNVVLTIRQGSGSGKLQEYQSNYTLTNQDSSIPFTAISDPTNNR